MSNVEPEILNDDFAFDFYREKCIKDVQDRLIKWSNDNIAAHESFSVAHNFFPGSNSNDFIVGKACSSGYLHKVIYLGVTNLETCIRRVQFRVAMGGHAIPETDILERYNRGLHQFNEFFKKISVGVYLPVQIDEVRVLDYTTDEEINNILEYKNGKIKVLATDHQLLSKWEKLLPEVFCLA